MASALKPNGGTLSASVNCGWRKITTLSVKDERNGGGNSFDKDTQGGLSEHDDANVSTLENDQIVNIWWDFGRCPLPLNFDAPKIASNITRALHHINIRSDLIYYFSGYGNVQAMGKDIVRFLKESGIQIIGFRLKLGDSFIVDDLLHSWKGIPQAFHFVISDGYGYPNTTLESLQKRGFILMPFEILLA